MYKKEEFCASKHIFVGKKKCKKKHSLLQKQWTKQKTKCKKTKWFEIHHDSKSKFYYFAKKRSKSHNVIHQSMINSIEKRNILKRKNEERCIRRTKTVIVSVCIFTKEKKKTLNLRWIIFFLYRLSSAFFRFPSSSEIVYLLSCFFVVVVVVAGLLTFRSRSGNIHTYIHRQRQRQAFSLRHRK